MAWTSPFDYTPGQVLTAANLDTYLSDNMNETAPGKVTTAGDIVYATAANTISRLGIGTAGKLLQVNSGATAPEWVSILSVLGVAYEYVDASVSTGSSTFVALTGGPSATVTVPPSGNIAVILSIQGDNDTASSFAKATVHDGSATKESQILWVKRDVGSESNTKIGVITGYTPGDSLTLTVRYAEEDGGNARFTRRFLAAMPW